MLVDGVPVEYRTRNNRIKGVQARAIEFFYDALETNDSAVAVMVYEVLSMIARELVETVRSNTGINWTPARRRARPAAHRGQAAPAQARVPARQTGEAADTVIEQAEALTSVWLA